MIQKPLPDKYIYDVQDTAGVGKFKKIDNKGRIILNYKEKDVIIIDRFSKNGFEKDQQVFFDKISNGKNLIIARELYNVFCFYDFSMNLLENYSFNESMSFLEKVVSDPSIKGDTFFKIGEFEKENYNVKIQSSQFGESFFTDTLIAIIIAFLFMGIIVFIYFRKFAPSLGVVLSAFSDIIITVAVINLLEIRLSTAGVAAILMIIGTP